MHANVLALGPELRDMARELTRDLNEAYYLTHCVVGRLLSEAEAGERPVDVETARRLLRQAAAEMRNPAPLAI
jgi:hypothetical protein